MRSSIKTCGYLPRLIREDYEFGNQKVPLVAFAQEPFDARSACIALAQSNSTPIDSVASCRDLGAPIVFRSDNAWFEWWSQGSSEPILKERIPLSGLEVFFRKHKNVFAPESVYRAKTRGRLDKQYQLDFVDVGLMPVVEEEIGRKLAEFVERVLLQLRHELAWEQPNVEQGRLLIRYTFWLLAGKILHDKEVPEFQDLDLTDAQQTFARVRAHYGAMPLQEKPTKLLDQTLSNVARMTARFASLSHVTTESLAEVYESSLITKETRRFLGIHSTPPWLVDYMLWRLEPWIRDIPLPKRSILEPACGHAAFLVAGLRLLRELLPKGYQSKQRHTYLRNHLIGIELDDFAVELARLSLTLADVPNPNGWNLISADMFANGILEHEARKASILIGNPPFEDFTLPERSKWKPELVNKASEMLARSLRALRYGSVFGVIVPAGFLRSKNATDVRSLLVNSCELQEITTLPDKVFRFSDMECAIILGRKVAGPKPPNTNLHYRWIREPQIHDFRRTYLAGDERLIPQQRFRQDPDCRLFAAELEEVWDSLKDNPRLQDAARVGEGLSFKPADSLPPDVTTYSEEPFPGAVRGFVHLGRELQLHEAPREMFVNVSQAAVSISRSGTQVGIPQVLMNHAPVSRGPWRIKAFIDFEGHACTNNFNVLRPLDPTFPLEFTWAILNSPVANAYVYTHALKRHNLPGIVGQIPIPKGFNSSLEVSPIIAAVREYRQLLRNVEASSFVSSDQRVTEAKDLLFRIDAELLRLYSLPPRLEKKLLDLFFARPREGVPFAFTEYYPADYRPCFSLYEYLSNGYQLSTAGELMKHWQESVPEAVRSALSKAVEEFER